MDSKALGVITGSRYVRITQVFEALYFAKDKVIVAGLALGFHLGAKSKLEPMIAWSIAREQKDVIGDKSEEVVLSGDKNNFAIPYSEVEKVEIKKYGAAALLYIFTKEKKYKWAVNGVSGKQQVKVDEIFYFLQPIFQEKVEIKKFFSF
jgi:hypothetical protein